MTAEIHLRSLNSRELKMQKPPLLRKIYYHKINRMKGFDFKGK